MAKDIRISRVRLAALKPLANIANQSSEENLSPYDFPQAIVSSHDRDTEVFWITVHYFDDEPALRVAHEDGIEIFQGRNSRKLVRIAIDTRTAIVEPNAITRLQCRIFTLLGKLESEDDTKQGLSWKLAKEVLAEDFAELTEELVQAMHSVRATSTSAVCGR